MHESQAARSRARSPFTAAFLSLIVPGLGQLYAGAPTRALAFMAAPILFVALVAGVALRMDRIELIGLVLNPFVLSSVFVVNLIVLLYRIVAIIDAYRVAEYLDAYVASGDGRAGTARIRRNPLSVAGLLAILLVMAGSHVVVARYDLLALDVLQSGCIFINDTSPACALDATPAPGASGDTGNGSSPGVTSSPAPGPTAIGSALPDVPIPAWNGKERLNILLIGSDQRPSEGTYNTDTLIVVSIDPVTKQVSMFGLPRDTVDIPVPPGPAQGAFGTVYRGKINGWLSAIRNRPDLYPGTDQTRRYNGLKAIMGNLYGVDIKYFVEVNFGGFKAVVDAVGGVTINVQIPVSDDRYPSLDGRLERLYIPSGIQHMDGLQALRYARSRHGSSDFDRGQRQQRVLLSLREQADPRSLIPQLPDLVTALKRAVRTDVPVSQLAQLLGLASQVDTKNIRSYVFAPPLYATDTCADQRGCVVNPRIDTIRAAVDAAFSSDPADEILRQTLAQEGARVWVLSGMADRDQGTRLAGYLEFRGLAASAPRQRPSGPVPAATSIVVYNGAEANATATIAYLEKTFGVKATLKVDSAIRTDIIVTIGRSTPDLQAPAGP